MLYYRIDKKTKEQMRAELAERHALKQGEIDTDSRYGEGVQEIENIKLKKWSSLE